MSSQLGAAHRHSGATGAHIHIIATSHSHVGAAHIDQPSDTNAHRTSRPHTNSDRRADSHCGVAPVHDDGPLAGISVAMKNRYGSVDRPGELHGSNCDPAIAELNNLANVRQKTRLIVCAALNVSPYDWNQSAREDALLLSFDPVALDTVGRDILVRHRQSQGHSVDFIYNQSWQLASTQTLALGTSDAGLAPTAPRRSTQIKGADLSAPLMYVGDGISGPLLVDPPVLLLSLPPRAHSCRHSHVQSLAFGGHGAVGQSDLTPGHRPHPAGAGDPTNGNERLLGRCWLAEADLHLRRGHHLLVPGLDHRRAHRHLVEHRRDNPAVHNAGVSLESVRDRQINSHLALGWILEEGELETHWVLQTTDEAHAGVRLFLH